MVDPAEANITIHKEPGIGGCRAFRREGSPNFPGLTSHVEKDYSSGTAVTPLNF
jgi:hypothetical protein